MRAETLNSDLENISVWATTWKVTYNNIKAELMNISRKRKPQSLPLDFENVVLKDRENHKYLGVILQNNGKWDTYFISVPVIVTAVTCYDIRQGYKVNSTGPRTDP